MPGCGMDMRFDSILKSSSTARSLHGSTSRTPSENSDIFDSGALCLAAACERKVHRRAEGGNASDGPVVVYVDPPLHVSLIQTCIELTVVGGDMDKFRRRRIALSLTFCVFSLVLVARTSGFDLIRPVQFLLIFVAGMNGGVALAQIRALRKEAAQ